MEEVDGYKLTKKGIQKARELIRTKQEARDFFLGLATNEVIEFMKANPYDPVKIILKVLETDLKLREEGLDWESYLLRLKRTPRGYVVDG
jgi:hypothetical protein